MSMLSSIVAMVRGKGDPAPTPPPSAPPAPAPEPALVYDPYTAPRLSESAQKELYSRPAPATEAESQRPMKRFERYGNAPITDGDVARIIEMAPPRINDELRAEIAKLDVEWQKIREFIAAHDMHSALRYAKQEAARLQAAIQSGDLETASKVQRLPREAVQDDFSVKRKIAKAHRREIEARAWTLVQPLIAEVAKSASKMADELEAQERKVCARFDRPFVPSITLAVLGQLTWRIESYIPRAGGPAAMLARFEPSTK